MLIELTAVKLMQVIDYVAQDVLIVNNDYSST